MHWVIQGNLVSQEDSDRLIQALDARGVEHTLVKLIPVVRELEVTPVIDGPVFVYGTTFIHRHAYNPLWWPGYIGGTANFQEISEGYGNEMLNAKVKYMPLSEVTVGEGEDVFVRPDDDGKLFTGKVVNAQELQELKDVVVGQFGSNALSETMVVAPPQNILAEYRCLVVDGQVITASYYRKKGRVFQSNEMDESVLEYAQKQVDKYQPEIGFALDIAETENGFKIIEVNSLSSCGFYACDLDKFVDAMETLGNKMRPQGKIRSKLSF